MKEDIQREEHELDQEWMELIMQARQLGFSVDDIRRYLKQVTSESASAKEMG